MSRQQPQRPTRDHVRLMPGQRAGADFDDTKLMALLQSAKKELQGLRLVHLHLGLLENTEFTDTTLITRVLKEVADNSAYLQIFNISNGDIIMLYKGLKFGSVEEVCKKIEMLLLAKTRMSGRNPYRENGLFSILELSLNFVHVIRFLEGIIKEETATPTGPDAKPEVTLDELAKIDKALTMFDLTPFIFNQPVVNIRDESDQNKEYFELYISIKGLQDRLSPDFDLSTNRWLFNYFTSSLDQSLLRSLNHGLDFIGNESVGININLSTALSSTFLKFDERLPPTYRGKVILEVNKVDLIENLPLYRELLDFAIKREYRICIDGLNEFWVSQLDFDSLGCDYAKVFWNSEMLSLDPDLERAFLDKVSSGGRCKFIMARCGTMAGLLYAHKHGLDHVQGRAIDTILRKGVKITEAIRTAMMLDE